ncbi:MAG: hypothetical protein ACI8TP_001778 [Acidimicrobiales bacterium]|jgi:hypothetical protein
MGTDNGIRAKAGELPFPEQAVTPSTAAKPLAEAKVAIVTTAGFRPAGEVNVWQTR